MSEIFPVLMSISMIAVAALIVGGIKLMRRGGDYRLKGVLMIIAALVLAGNVAILTL